MDFSFAKSMSFLFLVILSSFLQIQARESKFFSKITHASFSTTILPPTEAPTPYPATAPAPAPVTKSYYGLFGPGSGLVIPEKETTNTPTTTNDDNDLLDEELVGESYQTGYQNKNYNYNNGYTTKEVTTNNYNYNNGYTTTPATTNNYNYNNGYTAATTTTTGNKYMNNGYAENYKNSGYTASNYNNGYESEKQGMSDTRFVEGGKYYYDVKNENNYPNYGYEAERGGVRNEGYFGSTQNSNEFNTMEEYYQENQEKFLP
ncbi:hypothetical protein SLA2020_151250 [Shorea laevis]